MLDCKRARMHCDEVVDAKLRLARHETCRIQGVLVLAVVHQ